MARVHKNPITRQGALADFLSTRRARIVPAEVGLPINARRRVPGLRRDEVAQLANISTTWYTWLEQGRDIRMSVQTLDRIAQALRLSPEERAYLFFLAYRQAPPGPPPRSESVSPAVQRALDNLEGCPAHVKGRRWDVLAWNQADRAVFCDYEALPQQERNIIWIMFTHAAYRQLLVNWESHTKFILAQFRADCGQYVDDPWFIELIEKLQAVSPEFRRWWPCHDVVGCPPSRKELKHPVIGRVVLESMVFNATDNPDIKLVIHAPLPEANSGQKIRELLHQYRSAGSFSTPFDFTEGNGPTLRNGSRWPS